MSYSAGFSQSLEILFYIELKIRVGKSKYLTIQSISEKLNIPIPSVKRLVGLLKKTDLIESKKGVSGGLSLSKPAKDIRLYDVFIAVEGKKALFRQHTDFEINNITHKTEAEYMLKKSSDYFDAAEKSMLDELKKRTLVDFFQ